MKKVISALLTALLLAAPGLSFAGETNVRIDGSERTIPATISLPEGDGPFPFVVMFHGTGSDRQEAGNGYAMLAQRLAGAGIASARFDFAGNGESTASYADYTLTGGMRDGLDVIAYMQSLPQVDGDRLGLVGWSQGGTVAMLTAARTPSVRSLVTWAGATDLRWLFADQYDEAKANGSAVVSFDWRDPLEVSLAWFDEVRDIDIARELASYDGAVLAIAGSLDDVVPLSDLDVILDAVPTEAKRKEIIDGADHTFNVFSGDMSAYDETAGKTVEWFLGTL